MSRSSFLTAGELGTPTFNIKFHKKIHMELNIPVISEKPFSGLIFGAPTMHSGARLRLVICCVYNQSAYYSFVIGQVLSSQLV